MKYEEEQLFDISYWSVGTANNLNEGQKLLLCCLNQREKIKGEKHNQYQ